MKIRNIIHKGLKRFVEIDDKRGLSSAVVEKIRNIISFLQSMYDVKELQAVPSWKAHQMTGNRKGIWSIVVTRNWRITFQIDSTEETEIFDLNYEDYH